MISYSNHGYALAAYVVEQVTGMPFDRYVQDRILRPLGWEWRSATPDSCSASTASWRSTQIQRALLVLPLLSPGLGAGVIVLPGALWGRRQGSVAARLYYTFAGLAALLFARWLDYWNLLGFHPG